ncbi:hypothetical protein F0562_034530 [Nyssa sinensis]|uniref:Disease resistance N-terminal domain-containing protein n=1 Tax=Nyssa sinensis TaxID=561372 RepID=A0A5J5AJH9_9ASTE|nr:hypothetical protein F0562_034530 [Nyssa sinensis]
MFVAAIGFIVQNLKQLIEYHVDLIFGVKDQLASLYDDLKLLNASLKDFTNKPSNYEIVREWVRLIRDVGFEMEDAIDKYVVLAASHKAESRSRKALRTIYKYPAELREAGNTIQNVKSKLNGYKEKMFTNEILPPYHLRFLNDDECWELLRRKVFGIANCPSEEMENLGKEIAEKCHGLPLAVQVILESLLNNKNPGWWKTIAANMSGYVAKEPERCMNILALSYNTLTPHLKLRFIYDEP